MRSQYRLPIVINIMFMIFVFLTVPSVVCAQRNIPPVKQPQKEQSVEQRQVSVPWINVHAHLVGGRGFHKDYEGAVNALLELMERFRISTTIVMPPPQVDSQAPYDAQEFANALQRNSGRLAYMGGGGTLNPMIHRYQDTSQVTEAIKRDFTALAERIIDEGAVGFGEMASLHISHESGHPYEFVPADHPLFRLLADIAARRDVPIDLHMDSVDGQMPTPSRLMGHSNPPVLPDTLGGLERLLAYNPKAKIVWAHAGSDPLGAMTAATVGRLMDKYPNLYASLRIAPPQAPVHNKVLTVNGIDGQWLALFHRHADRFVLGTDAFVMAPSLRRSGPAANFAKKNIPGFQAMLRLLELLPPEIAQKIGRENAIRLYRLK